MAEEIVRRETTTTLTIECPNRLALRTTTATETMEVL